MIRRRLDTELVRRGLARSRSEASDLVASGAVLVGGALATKPDRLVAASEAVAVVGEGCRYVGRGGNKLDGALRRFGVVVAGRWALDVGSSTGGFTDCLLQWGAARVVACDVGRHQLHERLRSDPRVVVLEETDVRELDPSLCGGPFGLVVADVSFISLRLLAPVLVTRHTAEGGDLLVLLKPQFEAGPKEASRGRGVIRDPAIWRRVLLEVAGAFRARGASLLGAMPASPRGAEGNVEFFLWFRRGPAEQTVGEGWVDEVVSEVAG